MQNYSFASVFSVVWNKLFIKQEQETIPDKKSESFETRDEPAPYKEMDLPAPILQNPGTTPTPEPFFNNTKRKAKNRPKCENMWCNSPVKWYGQYCETCFKEERIFPHLKRSSSKCDF
jgi:hypothetical protein